jgi:hypothetical protein
MDYHNPDLEEFPQSNAQNYLLLMSQWLVHLTERILNSSNHTLLPPAMYPLSKAAQSHYKQLFRLLEPDRIALICLQEMTKISNYDSDLKGVPAMKLAGHSSSVIPASLPHPPPPPPSSSSPLLHPPSPPPH